VKCGVVEEGSELAREEALVPPKKELSAMCRSWPCDLDSEPPPPPSRLDTGSDLPFSFMVIGTIQIDSRRKGFERNHNATDAGACHRVRDSEVSVMYHHRQCLLRCL
jgi:hypothetical protein